MSQMRFLFDEDLPGYYHRALLRRDPTIDALRVGDAGAPPTGTKDPAILRWVASEHRALITYNRTTMKTHVEDLIAAEGFEHWGVFRVRPMTTVAALIEDLYTRWAASEAEEWIGWIDWVP